MAGVNVKMGVSGVAQFKQSMKESQASVKTLDQELKLNEAQLKLNGDAQQYMENKAGLLAHKLEEQKNVVKQAGDALKAMQANGVDKSSVAFQNMANQLYKAQTELLNTQAELEGVGNAGEDAQEGVSHMNQSLQRIGTNVSFENVVNGLEKITNGLEAAAKKAVELGKKLVQAMLQGGQWADDLQTTADQWEMTPEQVYRMRQTANMIDTSAETIFQARKKLTAAMGKEGNKETMGAFAALGITYFEGSDANIERVFWKAGEGLMNMEDKVARNEYATKLFGKSWEELIPIFKTGREEYEKTMASWDWVGDQQFESLLKIDDESNKLQSSWENIQHTLEASLAPSMLEIMQTLEGVLAEFNKYLTSDAGQEMLKTLGESVSGLFKDLASINPEEVVGKITQIFDKIREGLQWIIDNRQTVVDALKGIAIGFGLLKLTTLAANIGRIVTGLRGLGIGGGAAASSTAGAAAGGLSSTAANMLTSTLGMTASAAALLYPTIQKFATEGFKLGYAFQPDSKLMDAVGGAGTYDIYQKIQQHGLARPVDPDWRLSYQHGYGSNYYNPNMPSLERMTNVAEEMNGGVQDLSSASVEMTGAAQNMMNLPAELQAAVTSAIIAGMNSVTIVVDVNEIDRRVGGGIGNQILAMVR